MRHIHVRYEDTITNGDHAFACGLMLKQLVVCTTDAHWKPQRSEDMSGTMMHKVPVLVLIFFPQYGFRRIIFTAAALHF